MSILKQTFGAPAEHFDQEPGAPKRGVIYDNDLTAAERKGLSDRQPSVVHPRPSGDALAFSQLDAAERAKRIAELEGPSLDESAGEIAVAGTVQVDPAVGEMKRDRVALRRPLPKESV